MTDMDNRQASDSGSGRQIMLVGCGTGNRRYLTRQASAALRTAELYIGTPKLFKLMEDSMGDGRRAEASGIPQIRRRIEEAPESRIAVLMEGDTGMDSAAGGFASLLDLRPALIPGISLLSYISSRTGIPYGDAACVDLRKRYSSLIPAVASHRKVFAYGHERMRSFFREMIQAGYGGSAVYAVENPGEISERTFRGTVLEAAERGFSANSVFVFLRKGKERGTMFGLPDRLFLPAGEVSGREVRAAALARLEICPDDVVYCVGSGYGEYAVEAALLAPSGVICAVEPDEKKAGISVQNIQRFGVRNLQVIHGGIPDALAHLPAPDAVMIRWDGERFRDLIQILVSRNPRIRIAVVTEDPACFVRQTELLEAMHFELEETEIRTSGYEKTGDGGRRLRPGNPVFIVSGIRKTGKDRG